MLPKCLVDRPDLPIGELALKRIPLPPPVLFYSPDIAIVANNRSRRAWTWDVVHTNGESPQVVS